MNVGTLPTAPPTGHHRNSRFLVVDSEADEVPVVGGPVTVPRYDDAILPRGRRGEMQDVTFTWGTKVYL